MKKIVSILLVVLLFCSTLPIAYADSYTECGNSVVVQDEDSKEPRVEEVGWIYRNNNGVIEKRLWSYTYGRWLTDWIPTNV